MINSSRDTKILKILGAFVLITIIVLFYSKRGESIFPLRFFSPVNKSNSVDSHIPIKRQFAGVYYGVNVDMSQLLPGSKNYIVNSKGEDLINIANKLGINLFRITNVSRSFNDNSETQLYTKSQWDLVLNKMHQNGIKAIILIEANSKNPDLYSDTITPAYLQLVQDYIIKSNVGNNSDVYAIDLKNEPSLTINNINFIKQAATMVKVKYPSMLVTVGGWKVDANYNNSLDIRIFNWNQPYAGSQLNSLIDFYSVHIYEYDKLVNGMLPDPYIRTVDYINQVKTYAGTKPIIIEEFGEPNGEAMSDQESLGSPELQANVYAGVYKAVNDLRSKNVLGAVSYVFTQRGSDPEGWEILKDHGNYLFPAAYVLQKYSTGVTSSSISYPTSLIPQDFIFNNYNWEETKTIHNKDIVGLELNLDSNSNYSVMNDNKDILQEVEPLFYDSINKKYVAVFHTLQPGTSTISIMQSNKCSQTTQCNKNPIEKFKVKIIVE